MSIVRSDPWRHLPVLCASFLLIWKLVLLFQIGPVLAGDSVGYRLYANALLGREEPYFFWQQYQLRVNIYEQRPPLVGLTLAAAGAVFGSRDLLAYCVLQIAASCVAYLYLCHAARRLGCDAEAPIVLLMVFAFSYASFADYAILADSLFGSAFLIALSAAVASAGDDRPAGHLAAFTAAGFVLLTIKSFGAIIFPLIVLLAVIFVALRSQWRRGAAVILVATIAALLAGHLNARMSGSQSTLSYKSGDHVFHYANALFVYQSKDIYSFDRVPAFRSHAADAIEHSDRIFRRGVYLISKMANDAGMSNAQIDAELRRMLLDAALTRPIGFVRVTMENVSTGLLDAFSSVNRALMPMLRESGDVRPGALAAAAIIYDGWFAWIVSYLFLGTWFASILVDIKGLRHRFRDAVPRLAICAVAIAIWIPVAIINFEIRLIALTIPIVALFAARWLRLAAA